MNTDAERFRIEGNRLVVTSSFDPRFQRGVEAELLDTLQGMLEEQEDDCLVLDLHNRTSLPSMLIGILVESHRRVTSQKDMTHLIVRINPDHLRSIEWAGLSRIFDQGEEQIDENGAAFIELTSKPDM